MTRTPASLRTALIATLMLCFTTFAAAAPAARASLRLAENTPVALQPHEAGRSAEMVLQDEEVNVEIVGPVARLVVTQTWRYDGTWFSPGDEAVTELRTGPLSAIFDYWITEGNAIHRGIVRDRRSAVAEYTKNLEQRRDPGLVEWVDEGLYRMRLYPVPHNRGLKKQGFTVLTVLPLSGDGTVRLDWLLPVHRVERLRWRIRVAGGVMPSAGEAGGTAVSLVPAVAGQALEGELTGLPSATKRLELVVRAAPRPSRAWRTAGGSALLQVSEAGSDPEGSRPLFLACIAPRGAERELAAATGFPSAEVPAPDPAALPDVWLPPLRVAARALRLELDETRPVDAQGELASAAIVGPGVVLFANPFTTAQAIKAGWDQAQQEAKSRQETAQRTDIAPGIPFAAPPPPAPGVLSGLDFSMPTGIATPSFKSARERAGRSACFANQKTAIGAIEMYNVDKNVRVEAAILAAPCWHLKTGAVRSAPSVAAPGARGPVKPPAGVEWAYWRDRKRMGAYRVQHGLERTPTALPAATPESGSVLPPGFGLGFTAPAGGVALTPAWLWQELKQGGYLQSIPQDPGFGPGTETHYCLTGWGNGITCLSHGEIQPRLGPGSAARDQLVSEGVVHPQILAEALTYQPHSSSSRGTPFLGWLLLGVAITLGIWLLGIPFALTTSIKELRPGIHASGRAVVKSLLWSIPALLLGPLVFIPLGWAALRLGTALASLTVLTLRVLFAEE